MSTVSRRPLPTLKVKKLPPPRLSSPEKSKKTTTTTSGKKIDPLEKRLLDIRVHILHNTKRQQKLPSEPTLVYDTFLYIGGLKSLSNKGRLARLNITHILSVVYIPPTKNLIAPYIKHLFLKADDAINFDISVYFEQACQFIEDAHRSNGSVLVHCVCGVSRSTTLCCAYLMKHHAMTIEQALVQLRSRRHIIQPNIGFLRQLLIYDKQLQDEEIEKDNIVVDTLVEKIEHL